MLVPNKIMSDDTDEHEVFISIICIYIYIILHFLQSRVMYHSFLASVLLLSSSESE